MATNSSFLPPNYSQAPSKEEQLKMLLAKQLEHGQSAPEQPPMIPYSEGQVPYAAPEFGPAPMKPYEQGQVPYAPKPVIEATDPEMNVRNALIGQLRRQGGDLENDVKLQRALAQARMERGAPADRSGTLSMYFDSAGMAPAEIVKSVENVIPESELKRQEMLRKQLADVTTAQDKLDDNKNNRLKMQLEGAKAGKEENLLKVYTEASRAMDATRAGARSPIGLAQKAIQNVERAEALITSNKEHPLSPTQVSELYEALAQVVSGGSGGVSEGRIEKLSQDTLGMDLARAKSYVLNKPQDAKAQKFVEQIGHLLNREKTVLKNQVKRGQENVNRTYGPILEKHPRYGEMWRRQVETYGVNPDYSATENMMPVDVEDEEEAKFIQNFLKAKAGK